MHGNRPTIDKLVKGLQWLCCSASSAAAAGCDCLGRCGVRSEAAQGGDGGGALNRGCDHCQTLSMAAQGAEVQAGLAGPEAHHHHPAGEHGAAQLGAAGHARRQPGGGAEGAGQGAGAAGGAAEARAAGGGAAAVGAGAPRAAAGGQQPRRIRHVAEPHVWQARGHQPGALCVRLVRGRRPCPAQQPGHHLGGAPVGVARQGGAAGARAAAAAVQGRQRGGQRRWAHAAPYQPEHRWQRGGSEDLCAGAHDLVRAWRGGGGRCDCIQGVSGLQPGRLAARQPA
mmetsp:Transcript_28271/g.72080  ORF Transcript_28271/g.72080 Transcript_28271/m.72080 type:complete len:283 (-) Transcript_28271:2726-3574(-)